MSKRNRARRMSSGEASAASSGALVATASPSNAVQAFAFGDPEPVLNRREIMDMVECYHNGRWYLQRLAFGGRVEGRSYGVSTTTGARFNVTKLEPMLADIHERLAGVTIEQLGYAEFIRRYDRAGMLFYLDPPYWGCETDYGQDVFGRADFDQLADQLAGIKGQFVLSINDTPGARATFARFHVSAAETTYTVGGAAKRAGELIVSSMPLS